MLILARLINAQESEAEKIISALRFEKIRDVSPDQKFALRISCSVEPDDTNNIPPYLITAVELVSLPSKEVVTELPQNYDGGVPHLIWSGDSKWLAFPLSDSPRLTYTHVYRRTGNDFSEFKADNLQVDIKGDVRNEYVRPIGWVKPGVLLLEQFDIFRGAEDATYRFTAKFHEKTGKFRVISKNKVPSKE